MTRWVLVFMISLVIGNKGFGQGAQDTLAGRVDLVHHFKKEGPVSIQFIWLTKEPMPRLWFDAAFHAGTKNYPEYAFQHRAEDYRIEFDISPFNGGFAIGVTFAQSQYRRALDLLNEFMHHNRWKGEALAEWKKKQLFHFQYYRNDPDSLMKWWMNGREADMMRLKALDFSEEYQTISERLGSPQLVSVVGRIDANQVEKDLSFMVQTVPKAIPEKQPTATPHNRREDLSDAYGVQFTKVHDDQILDHVLYQYFLEQAGTHLSNCISEDGFASPRVNLVVTAISNPEISLEFDVQETVHGGLVSDMMSGEDFSRLYLEARKAFILWSEFNKNEALYQGLVRLGVWTDVSTVKANHYYDIMSRVIWEDRFIGYFITKGSD